MSNRKLVIYSIILTISSAYSRVAIEDKLPDISSNLLDKEQIVVKPLPLLPTTTEYVTINDVIETHNKATANSNLNEVTNEIETDTNTVNTTEKTEGISSKNKHGTTLEDKTANNTTENTHWPAETKIDNGIALLLSPLIEEGRIEEARKASRVDPKLFLGFESYSGFFTVNKTYNSNLFFWYFPVETKPVNETPWIIWLQGGPGASSMTGLFDEIGPFHVGNNNSLTRNPFTWLRNHSLLFIDNPVGTGYSFTNHVDGYARDMTTYSQHLYSTVKQFLQVFPELRHAPLYIAGESYAGKYVPALGLLIHKNKERPGADVNLQGMIIGNAYVDPGMITHLTSPFYYFGLLDSEQLEIVKPLLSSFREDIAANRSVEAKNKWNSLITVLLFLTHQKHAYNFLRDELAVGKYWTFLKQSEIKRALHVGDLKFGFVNMTVNLNLAPDFLSSTKSTFETLLDHYRVLAYCGQLDQMLPCVFASENYRTWKWNASDEFLKATRYPYIFDNRLAGYHKTGGNLTEVVVRGAGHMVPLDAAAPAQALVARWTHSAPLSRRFSLLHGSFVQEYVRNNSLLHYL